MAHDCYTSARFLIAYGPKIYPCADKSIWKKVQGVPIVLPFLYEKKVGRPPKNRRKQPVELEGTSETKMPKHGMQMTCSYCGDQGHNRAGCQLRKSGIRPKL
jgi:hypothetical protein